MRALTVLPKTAESIRIDDVDAPPGDGALLVRALLVGVCGTDRDIVKGDYGEAPLGRERLILGHESLGEVVEAPSGSGFERGDLVVGVVRRPDPVPCASCAAGEWDMCRNGRYAERGIKRADGFASEFFRLEPAFAVRVDPGLRATGVLLEPASVVAKVWEQVERIGRRAAAWNPRVALITGAGPIGLLAALFAVQRGLDVHVFDRTTEGPKPDLVRQLGAAYYGGSLAELDEGAVEADIVIECTGASSVVFDVMTRVCPIGIVCLAGISSGGRTIAIDGGLLNRTLVLENTAVFGSVNANLRHYRQAAEALARADAAWLRRLISRRVPLRAFREAFRRMPDDIKVVLDFEALPAALDSDRGRSG